MPGDNATTFSKPLHHSASCDGPLMCEQDRPDVPGVGAPPPWAESLLSALGNADLPRYARLFIAKVTFTCIAKYHRVHPADACLRCRTDS